MLKYARQSANIETRRLLLPPFQTSIDCLASAPALQYTYELHQDVKKLSMHPLWT